MNCESWLEPKKLWITAEIVRALMRSYGVTCSASWIVVRYRKREALALLLGAQQQLVRELAVQFVSADLGQVIALRIEKELLQDIPGGVRARRLAGTQEVVDARERLVLGLGGVLLQRVPDDVRFVPMRDDERLHGPEAGLP